MGYVQTLLFKYLLPLDGHFFSCAVVALHKAGGKSSQEELIEPAPNRGAK